MAFDIMKLQRNRGPQGQQDQPKSKAEEQGQRAELKYIDVYDLVPSENNFYSMHDIEEMAQAIKIAGGVKQPGLVVPMGGGKYRLIAGHRRRAGSILLVNQGEENYRFMPCMVEEVRESEADTEAGESPEELQEINEGILLIVTNCQRIKTDWDKVEEATRLRELLARKRKFQKVPGKTRQIIAEQLKTTPAQVGRYESIAKHLLPEFKEAMKAEQVNISVGYELSTLSEKGQRRALAEFREKGALSIEDVKRQKSAEDLPGQTSFGWGENEETQGSEQSAQESEPEKAAVEKVEELEEHAEPEKEEAAPSSLPESEQEKEDAPEPNTEEAEEQETEVVNTPETDSHSEENGRRETRCIDAGICPHCGERFNAEEAVNYSTQGTQFIGPVPCPHCRKPISIFCSVEFFCSVPEE